MKRVNNDAEVLEYLISNIKNVQKAIDMILKDLAASYKKQQWWNDKKYHELGDIINDISRVLTDNINELKKAQGGMCKLRAKISDYLQTGFESKYSWVKKQVKENIGKIVGYGVNAAIEQISIGPIPIEMKEAVSRVCMFGVDNREVILSDMQRLMEQLYTQTGENSTQYIVVDGERIPLWLYEPEWVGVDDNNDGGE